MWWRSLMARPRIFDESVVLEAAAAQFRVHGYADTSTEQLCEAADVRRSSLYNAFTSEDELFVRALEHYASTMRARQTSILTDTSLSGADRIRAGCMDGGMPDGSDAGEGALLVNTLISGIRVTAQTGVTPEILHRIALDGQPVMRMRRMRSVIGSICVTVTCRNGVATGTTSWTRVRDGRGRDGRRRRPILRILTGQIASTSMGTGR
jgi:AcrR family transcriptional regulator